MRSSLRTATRLLEPALRQSVLTASRPAFLRSLPSIASEASRTFATSPTCLQANSAQPNVKDPNAKKGWWKEWPASQQVFVRNLPKDMDEAKFQAFLAEKVGGRAPARLRVLSATNRRFAWAYIHYDDAVAAEKCRDALAGMKMDGPKAHTDGLRAWIPEESSEWWQRNLARTDHPKNCMLYVAGLPEGLDLSAFREKVEGPLQEWMGAQLGQKPWKVQMHMRRDEDGKNTYLSSGKAYAHFWTKAEMEAALESYRKPRMFSKLKLPFEGFWMHRNKPMEVPEVDRRRGEA